jgi:hypothetical protein
MQTESENQPKSKQIDPIFLGPVEIAGYYQHLAAGLRSRGLKAEFVSFSPHPFEYGLANHPSPMISIIGKAWPRSMPSKSWLVRGLSTLPWLFLSHVWGLYAIFHYRTFIFGFGRSLFIYNLDLPILKLLGKTVIMNLGHGSEARPAYLDGSHLTSLGPREPSFYFKHSRIMKRRLAFIEKFSSVIIGSPLSSHFFLRNAFVNWFSIGIPSEQSLEASEPNFSLFREADVQKDHIPSERAVIALHAPSNPIAKGSNAIKLLIHELQREGYPIVLQELSGVTNAQVIEKLRGCDFVLDQVYSDTPLSGLAAEAAAFGIPTIIGTYATHDFDDFFRRLDYKPSIYVLPGKMKETVRDCILNPEVLLSCGKAAKNFISQEWSAIKVADRYLLLITGEVPETWMSYPSESQYVFGACQSKKTTKQIITGIVSQYGIHGLNLSDRPDLVNQLINCGLLHHES